MMMLRTTHRLVRHRKEEPEVPAFIFPSSRNESPVSKNSALLRDDTFEDTHLSTGTSSAHGEVKL